MQSAECRRFFATALSAFCILHSAFAGFQPALPRYEFAFPRDHGTHDEYRTEWWYYTGHLTADDGKRYGFELTFFRVGVVPSSVPSETRWDLHNLALAHFAITDTTAGSTIFYTTDGTTPATSATGTTKQYTGAISVATSQTIKAIATASGLTASRAK